GLGGRFFHGGLGLHLRSFVTATKPQPSLIHNLKSVPLVLTGDNPMDTGLVENIPAYNIETIRVASGPRDLATIMVWGSVAEDPAFSLLLPAGTGAVTLRLRDSNGREFTGHVAGPQRP
ncbi:thiosulfate oxidation carrier complex protein SoxZ, partial [Novosphingobium flavum]|nr:thiosulfate oxidation carrier complex protein SoxZ [Novosphingobium aerophilum]